MLISELLFIVFGGLVMFKVTYSNVGDNMICMDRFYPVDDLAEAMILVIAECSRIVVSKFTGIKWVNACCYEINTEYGISGWVEIYNAR